MFAQKILNQEELEVEKTKQESKQTYTEAS